MRIAALIFLLSSVLTSGPLAQAKNLCNVPSGICLRSADPTSFDPENAPFVVASSILVPGLYNFIPANAAKVKITIYKDDMSVFIHYRRGGFDWHDERVNSKKEYLHEDLRIGTAIPLPGTADYGLVLDAGVTFRLLSTIHGDRSFCLANDHHRYHYPTKYHQFSVKRENEEVNFTTSYVTGHVTATSWWISTRWCSPRTDLEPNTLETFKYE